MSRAELNQVLTFKNKRSLHCFINLCLGNVRSSTGHLFQIITELYKKLRSSITVILCFVMSVDYHQ